MFCDAMSESSAWNDQIVSFRIGKAAAEQCFNGSGRKALLDQRDEIPVGAEVRNAQLPAQSGI